MENISEYSENNLVDDMRDVLLFSRQQDEQSVGEKRVRYKIVNFMG